MQKFVKRCRKLVGLLGCAGAGSVEAYQPVATQGLIGSSSTHTYCIQTHTQTHIPHTYTHIHKHTSGFPTLLSLQSPGSPDTLQEDTGALECQPFMSLPGVKSSYTATGFELLEQSGCLFGLAML